MVVAYILPRMKQNILSKLSHETEDPRYFQILFLGAFLTYGIGYLGWIVDAAIFVAILFTSVGVQLISAHFTTRKYSSVKSALITALGLCLLLKTSSVPVAVLAAAFAISTKFIIRIKNKHIFNPANIGIVAAILFTNEAWVSPGQWGSSTLLWFFVGAAGLMMILKVGRIDTTLTFLGVFGGLLFCRQVLYLGWEYTVWLHMMSNGTLLLFAFFMITDPMTTPNHKHARILWSALLGIVLFVASNFFYIQTAAVWLLFVMSPFTPLFDKYFVAQKYSWTPTQRNTSTI